MQCARAGRKAVESVDANLGSQEYHKCIACRKDWCNRNLAERRLEYALAKLERYSKSEDWHSERACK